MKIRSIDRTATFTWSQGDHIPLLATGTVAGALDASFSSSTELEIFDLSLDFSKTSTGKIQKLGSASANARYALFEFICFKLQ